MLCAACLGTLGWLGCGKATESIEPSKPNFAARMTEPNVAFWLHGLRLTWTNEGTIELEVPSGTQPTGEEKLTFETFRWPLPSELKSPLKSLKTERNEKGIPVILATLEAGEVRVRNQGVQLVLESELLKNTQPSDPRWKVGDSLEIWNAESPVLPTSRAERPEVKIVIEKSPERTAQLQAMIDSLRDAWSRPFLPIEKHGIGPFGVSNSLYFGHTFWDADVWMLPSALWIEPDLVRQLAKYRIRTESQAKQNAQVELQTLVKNPQPALKFPWESGLTGKETVPGPSQKEIHISGSVVWGLTQAEAAGLVDPNAVQRIANGVASYYRQRAIRTGQQWELHDVMSPDENHIGNNDLYTNLLASWVADNRRFSAKPKFKLPKDEKSLLTYDNDRLKGYKQAAAVLSIFPLQFPQAEREAKVLMERFGDQTIQNGPAMSESIHALIWALLGENEKSIEAFNRSIDPFLTPQGYFSEKRTNARTYFVTGAAGVINSVLYGFVGMRLDPGVPPKGAKWSKKLKSGWTLSITPHVPKSFGTITLDGVIIDGNRTKIQAKADGSVTVQPSEENSPA